MAQTDNREPRILIIDDMAINQMLLSSQLAALGVAADASSSGEKGLALYRKQRYDLVLLDRHMPDMDGFETFQRLKEIFEEQGRNVPVICETADDDAEAVERLKEAGFAEVLLKPIDFGELHDMMMRQLGERYQPASAAKEATEEEIEASYEKLPVWLYDCKGLDVRYGLKRCGGSADDYLDALTLFAASIHEKAKTVAYYLEEDNERLQILRLHSLKSSARLVGAVALAEQAAALELAGKVGNKQAILSGTEVLIEHYRELEEQLKAHLDTGTAKVGKLPPISDETLHELYAALREAVQKDDETAVRTLLSSFGEYALSEEDAVRFERLKISHRKQNHREMLDILAGL